MVKMKNRLKASLSPRCHKLKGLNKKGILKIWEGFSKEKRRQIKKLRA
jgi:lipid II:glycine glycyltransferase (peptidoglycan interpeptide bridge formation enzyme)